MSHPRRLLTDDQIELFHRQGHLVIEGAFSRDFAAEQVTMGYTRLGIDPADPTTWTEEKVHMPGRDRFQFRDFAPKAWDAVCDLMGGEDRVK